jgi:site-specific DNA recombinase
MRRCGLYVRVSTDNQAREPEGSLKNQTQRLREALHTHSLSGDPWKEVKSYVEEGYSGKNINRPRFKEMLMDIQQGVIDTVLCTELSRISRSVLDFLKILEFFERYNIEFIVLKQNIDTTTPFGKVVFTILVALAEFEREMTGQRTSENMLARAKRGLWNGGNLLGYDRDFHNKGYLVVNKKESKLAKLIFEKYLGLKSCVAVAKWLNDRGYRTKEYSSIRGKHHNSGEFISQYVHKVLKNFSYVGKKEVNKKNINKDQTKLQEQDRYFITKAVWPPIIKQELFDRVQIALKRRFRRSPRQLINHDYLLSGLLKCKFCGRSLEGSTNTKKNGKKYYYYRHSPRNKGSACSFKEIPALNLEALIKKRIQVLISENSDLIDGAVKLANDKLRKKAPELKALISDKQKDLTSVRLGVDTLIKKMSSLPERQIVEIISPKLDEYHKRESQIFDEITKLKSEFASLEVNYIKVEEFRGGVASILGLMEKVDAHKQRELLASMIDEVIIDDKSIEICYYNSSLVLSRDATKFFFEQFELHHQCGANLQRGLFLRRVRKDKPFSLLGFCLLK